MRELNIGEQTVRVRATPLALLYYKQEFKGDLISDLIKVTVSFKDIISSATGKELANMTNVHQLDLSKIDTNILESFNFDAIALLKITWAMAKANSYGKEFLCFESWLNSFEHINLFDKDFLAAALGEAANGFFRGAKR